MERKEKPNRDIREDSSEDKIIELLKEDEQEHYIYKGPTRALEMLTTEQLELLQATTALDSSQLSVYKSIEIDMSHARLRPNNEAKDKLT